MNLRAAKDRELRERGRSWLFYIGIISCENEDIIQNAMIKLYKFHEKFPEVDDEEFADKNWKRCLDLSYVDWVRKTKAYKSMLERYADSIDNQPEREVFILEARSILLDALALMNDKELAIVLALMENDFVQTWAAKELGVSQQYVQASIRRMRERLSPEFDLTHNPEAKGGGKNKYLVKRTTLGLVVSNCETWTSYLPDAVEVVVLEDLTREEFQDKAEADKVWPVMITKGE